MTNLPHQVAIYRELRARLSAIPELADDEQALADTLEGVTDLREGLIAVMQLADLDEALAEGVDARMQQMDARRQRFSVRAEKRKELILWAMQESGITKIEAPDFTLSVANNPDKVVIVDEKALPEKYLRVTTTTAPDKKAIGTALKANEAIPGATLGNGGQRLAVRRI